MLNQSLLQAYEQTNYCFNDITLNIGMMSKDTTELFTPYNALGGIFITAWNPYGKVRSHTENNQANESLKSYLLSLGLKVIDGYGESPDGKWREESYFAYPVDKTTCLALCSRFKQNAVVYVNHNGLAELVFSD